MTDLKVLFAAKDGFPPFLLMISIKLKYQFSDIRSISKARQLLRSGIGQRAALPETRRWGGVARVCRVLPGLVRLLNLTALRRARYFVCWEGVENQIN